MINNTDSVIDSRVVIARIDELESEQADMVEQLSNGEITEADMVAFDQDEGAELDILRRLAEEAERYCPDWQDGVALINKNYFTEYIMELLVDIGDLPREVPHYIVIDEEATAENIKQDYIAVDYDGETYYIR